MVSAARAALRRFWRWYATPGGPLGMVIGFGIGFIGAIVVGFAVSALVAVMSSR